MHYLLVIVKEDFLKNQLNYVFIENYRKLFPFFVYKKNFIQFYFDIKIIENFIKILIKFSFLIQFSIRRCSLLNLLFHKIPTNVLNPTVFFYLLLVF